MRDGQTNDKRRTREDRPGYSANGCWMAEFRNLSIQDDYNTIISTFLQLFCILPCTAPFRHSFTHLPAISPDHLKPIQISMKQMHKLDFLHLHLSARDCKVSLQHHVGFHLSIVSLNKSKQIFLFWATTSFCSSGLKSCGSKSEMLERLENLLCNGWTKYKTLKR